MQNHVQRFRLVGPQHLEISCPLRMKLPAKASRGCSYKLWGPQAIMYYMAFLEIWGSAVAARAYSLSRALPCDFGVCFALGLRLQPFSAGLGLCASEHSSTAGSFDEGWAADLNPKPESPATSGIAQALVNRFDGNLSKEAKPMTPLRASVTQITGW